jgi:hypothetical protein
METAGQKTGCSNDSLEEPSEITTALQWVDEIRLEKNMIAKPQQLVNYSYMFPRGYFHTTSKSTRAFARLVSE